MSERNVKDVARRIAGVVGKAGVASRVIGCAYPPEFFVVLRDGEAVIRVSNEPEDRAVFAREPSAGYRRDSGWANAERRLADFGPEGARRRATHHDVRAVMETVFNNFSVPEEVRRKAVGAFGRAELSVKTRERRRVGAEEALALEVAGSVMSSGYDDALREQVGADVAAVSQGHGLKRAGVARVLARVWSVLAEEMPPERVCELPPNVRRTEMLSSYRDIVHLRLDDLAVTRGQRDPDALRSLVWDALRGYPIDWRVEQAAWLSGWAKTPAPQAHIEEWALRPLDEPPRWELGHGLPVNFNDLDPRNRITMTAIAHATTYPLDHVSIWARVSGVQRSYLQRRGDAALDEVLEPYRNEAEIAYEIVATRGLRQDSDVMLRLCRPFDED